MVCRVVRAGGAAVRGPAGGAAGPAAPAAGRAPGRRLHARAHLPGAAQRRPGGPRPHPPGRPQAGRKQAASRGGHGSAQNLKLRTGEIVHRLKEADVST